jgi:hypothetical protein
MLSEYSPTLVLVAATADSVVLKVSVELENVIVSVVSFRVLLCELIPATSSIINLLFDDLLSFASSSVTELTDD